MSITGLLLISNLELVTLAACWIAGAALIVGLFLYNRSRIRGGEPHE